MNAKLGSTSKLAAVRTELGQAVGGYAGRLAFGLVAFGHRKASNCADSELLAKPGELTAETQSKLLDKIKPKGQAPIAAALSDAAKAAPAQGRLDIVLIADGGDTCDADLCSTAVALKEKSADLRIHVLGFGKEEETKPLACLAAVSGGTFVAAKDAGELKAGRRHRARRSRRQRGRTRRSSCRPAKAVPPRRCRPRSRLAPRLRCPSTSMLRCKRTPPW